MALQKEHQGELFVLIEASLWAFFPVVTILTQVYVPPLVSLGICSLLASGFFALVLTVRKKWRDIFNTAALCDILIATGIIGILFYILSFIGLKHTSAGNASIIGLSEIFFSYLIFNLWKKENIDSAHIIGACLIALGVIIIFFPSIHNFQVGDILILVAASIAPIGNFFQRRARTHVSSESILFIRSFISGLFIISLAIFSRNQFSIITIKSVFFLMLFNGIFILGLSKVLWIESIHRISVLKANALGSVAPLLTLLYAWVLLHKPPTVFQIIAFIPIFIGVIYLSKTTTNAPELNAE